MTSPSGRSLFLSHDGYEAELVEVGAGLRALRHDGYDVVAGYARDEMCSAGRGQLLIPWPNRIRDGRYEFEGVTLQLALTEPAARNAIHGLTRWVNWSLLDHSAASAIWGLELNPQPGYPFSLDLTIDYTLGDQGLRAEVSATNVGQTAAPYGSGAHPYLTVGRPIDECELTLPATIRAETDERGIPGDPAPVAGGPFDFSSPRFVGDTTFDHPFGGLVADEHSVARVFLLDPDSGRSAALWVDASYRWLQVYSGDKLGGRAREALAVEPMTCPPDAFNTGVDLIALQPGDTHTASFGLA
ncbi:MAG: aldose 1-epimerase family protein [Nocardioidaceae bacterium]|nr:aldose 1-epimerase family protein [Nocardioidaceae bacterium]